MIGTTIGRYTITSRLVSGSFGETWLAHDASLDRTVALKLLPSSLAQDQTTRARLLQEVRAAGAIEHPNIASVHDSGELADGRLWVAMRWSGGQSLREKEQAGPLPVDEAVDIAIQAGRGLLKARQGGLVHRDLSPQSVVVAEDGRARILPSFQGAAADENSDTSGLQALLSEMLGRGTRVPAELQKVIDGCCSGMAEMVGELEWVAGKVSSGTLPWGTGVTVPGALRRWRTLVAALSAVALIGAGVGGYFLWKAKSAASTAAERVTIVLLPITNGVGTSAQDMLGDVMTDGLMTDLTKIRALRVISQNSAKLIKADESIALVGKRLGADFVLRGSAGREGDQVLLTLELWQAGTKALFATQNAQSGIWSVRKGIDGTWVTKEFRDAATELNAIVSQAAVEASWNAWAGVTADERKRIAGEKAIRPEARELYLKGRKLADDPGNPASLEKAIEFLWAAVEMEPEYAEAWAALGLTLSEQGTEGAASVLGVSVDEALTRARELDASSYWVQVAVGSASGNLGRYAEQETALEAAIKANPNLAQAHSSYAMLLARYKRYDEALVEANEGVRLDPLSIIANRSLIQQYIGSRHYAQGIPVILKLLELSPDDPIALRDYGRILAEMGRHEEGIRYLDKAVTLGAAGGEAYRGYALARKGDYAEARAIAGKLARAWNPKDALGAQQVAMIRANTGELELAMEWLGKASSAGGPEFLRGLDMSPEWDPLASTPEFREMVKMPGSAVAALPALSRSRTAGTGTQTRPVVFMYPMGHESSNLFYQRLHDHIVQQTGVEFTYRDVPDDYNRELQAALAARLQIDVFSIGSSMEMRQYRERRVIQDITDALSNHGRNMNRLFTEAPGWADLKKGDLWRPVTIDGRIWAIPTGAATGVGVVLSVRKDWRERLGIDPIETIDQLEAYLRKVKVTDLNANGAADEIPFNPMYGSLGLSGLSDTMTFPFIGATGWHHEWFQPTYLDGQGRVTPTVLHPEFRTFLARMAAWHRDGLLPPNLVASSLDQDNELLAANRVGATASWYWEYYDAWQTLTETVPEATYEHVVLKGPDGSPGKLGLAQGGPSVPGWAYAAWAPREMVVAGMKLQDWFAANKDNFLVQVHGVQGTDWRYLNKGTDAERPDIEHISDKNFYSYFFFGYSTWNAVTLPPVDWQARKRWEANVYLGGQQYWFRPDWFVPYFFKGTVVEKDNAKAAEFINAAIVDIIMNKAPLSGWDAKVAEYRAMWADQFIKAATVQYNKAIGRK